MVKVIYKFSHGHDITGHAPVLEVKLQQLQALLKIHCIDLADSTDPLAPSSDSFTALHLEVYHRYTFSRVLMIIRNLSDQWPLFLALTYCF